MFEKMCRRKYLGEANKQFRLSCNEELLNLCRSPSIVTTMISTGLRNVEYVVRIRQINTYTIMCGAVTGRVLFED